MLSPIRCLVASLMCVVAVAACSDGDASDPGAKEQPNGGSGTGNGQAAGPTYHKDVEPILQQHCQKCHVEGGLAPFALLTYEDARSMSPVIVRETSARN